MKRLYEKNSYITECVTTVTACEERADGIYIMLEDTIFFPEEGGQYADTGFITYNDIRVDVLDGRLLTNATTDVNMIISYKVSDTIPVGTQVTCHLDWEKRFSRMQNHSGEHILTGLIHNKFGFDNVGFHLSDDGPVTLNINGILSLEQVLDIEKAANRVIYDNLAITDSYPTKEELVDITYRSKIDIAGQVRLITVGENDNIIDVCACCAPHVSRTGEIGIIKVISVINYKGGVQIAMLAGSRALEYINHIQQTLQTVAGSLTTHPDNIMSVINSNRSELADCKEKLNRLIEEKYVDIANQISPDDIHCIFCDDELSSANMKNIYNALTAKFPGFVGIFVGNDEIGYRYNAGSSDLDSTILGTALKELGAKGGGNSDMIQGRIATSEEQIVQLFQTI